MEVVWEYTVKEGDDALVAKLYNSLERTSRCVPEAEEQAFRIALNSCGSPEKLKKFKAGLTLHMEGTLIAASLGMGSGVMPFLIADNHTFFKTFFVEVCRSCPVAGSG